MSRSRIARRRGAALGLLALAAVVGAGCMETSPAPPAAAPSAAPQVEVRLELADAAGLERAVAAHRGKVVLVDFWATWCLPCTEMLPHTVALHRQYADRGLAVIAVSVDERDEQAKAAEFLRAQGATFENYLQSYASGQEAFTALGLDGVPALRLFDRAGKLHREFSPGPQGPLDLAELDRAIERLLATAR